MACAKPWLIVGTVPDEAFPIYYGKIAEEDGCLLLEKGQRVPFTRGTPALLGAFSCTCLFLQTALPEVALVGDIGQGNGSRNLYEALCETILPHRQFAGVTFHYLYPDVDWHNRLLMLFDAMEARPCLVADAGFMYAAKMAGFAKSYDLFTPDSGELAFLADEHAPHPFYTRGFLLGNEDVETLITRAYEHENAASWMIVKGKYDRIVHKGTLLATIREPNIPAMEAIGGTGDMVCGIASALLASGFSLHDATVKACMTARIVADLAKPNPATQIACLLPFIPRALEKALSNRV
ncbi:MAG: sugar kinase [Desulfovibrio sp.]|nr:sugar kinase [Desulfovibrio sp.]